MNNTNNKIEKPPVLIREHLLDSPSYLYILNIYSRLHIGGGTAGNTAEFPSAAAVHVVVGSPISSKPTLQV